MINFYNGFVACDPNNAVLSDVVGIDHLGIGSDYDGIPSTPNGLDDVSMYPNLFKQLLDKEWTEDDLIKLAGGNILRVFSQVEQFAKSIISDRPINDLINSQHISNIVWVTLFKDSFTLTSSHDLRSIRLLNFPSGPEDHVTLKMIIEQFYELFDLNILEFRKFGMKEMLLKNKRECFVQE
ncbi:dipeptidase 1-like isoform X1 [Brachionus plicatilis]|uniref:Dipeptidase n=1 Tax=Brachionus plicatilis TaxID=10195 RepID=A0A3M7QZP4_BRAPC|nr:dipeptidase 1-like isoform X1 [Brachionus plicatilis]